MASLVLKLFWSDRKQREQNNPGNKKVTADPEWMPELTCIGDMQPWFEINESPVLQK